MNQSPLIDNPIELLEEIRSILELKGESRFKVLAFEKAARTVAGRTDLMERAKAGTLTEIPGIGKAIAEILTEFLLQGSSTYLEDLKKSIPEGLIALSEIPGLGPKKATLLIDALGVQSVAELEYACKENRLLQVKGFGLKIQQKILEAILFRNSNQGLQRYSEVSEISQLLLQDLRRLCSENQVSPSKQRLPGHPFRVEETGELRRKVEVLSKLEYLVEKDEPGIYSGTEIKARIESFLPTFVRRYGLVLPIEIHYAASQSFDFEWARTTGTSEHWFALGNPPPVTAQSEQELYKKWGLPWIPPEMRETGEEVMLARQGKLEQLLPWDGVQGIFHNHTTRSDGSATLEEMVQEAKELGYKYIGISDHSQSAFYAQGLKPDTLLEQEREINSARNKFPEIRIFWGIESDILADGSLDYPPEILERFDFVIASIHSRFKMDRESMTERILKAVRNPHTRFLGHPTGRLLLGRNGYDVDLEKVISEAAEYDVAMELNANPSRLDLDWRWGPIMRHYGTLTSINPDAHNLSGLQDTQYGIAMARKALIPAEQILNSRPVDEVEKWLRRDR